MSIAIDLGMLAIIFFSTYLGYRKGLIGVAFKLVSFLIAILITLILYKPVTNLIITNTTVDENIEQFIITKFAGTNTTEEGKIQQEETDLPSVVVNYINSMVKDAVDSSKETIVNTVAHGLTINIINILVMIILFIITRLLLLFAKALLEVVSQIPIIKQCNEVGGIVYGIVRGILLIYVVFAIGSILLPYFHKTELLNSINSSFLGNLFYNHNLILMLFFKN